MRILLSNDDGILAPGLAALRSAVADMGEVTVVAPDSPRSAAGHAITLEHPLTVQQVHIGGAEKFAAISVDGSPADCVRLAVISLLDNRPDLVLAGINAGANVGINVFYSGTVAAAAEAVMLRLPAVAFSVAMTTGEVDFDRAGRLCRCVLDALLEHGLSGTELINVNIPELRAGWPRGVRVCAQSTAGVQDVYHKRVDAQGREVYKISDEFAFAEPHQESDVVCLAEGYITVTPLHVDMTSRESLPKLSKCRWGEMPD